MAVTCAICRVPTVEVLNFGQMPLANGYAEPTHREPLSLHWCSHCDLYQLGSLVPSDTLFTDYAYRTGITRQSKVWRELESAVARRCDLPERPFIVDVGGNDGTLLAQFAASGRTLLNIDPYAPPEADALVRTITLPWNVETAEHVQREWQGTAHLILATNVWAHMPDLHGSAAAATTLLHEDGWLVVQAPWYRDLMLYGGWDTIYHEHAYYLGVQAMRRLFQRHQMDVHHVDYLPDVHGGSLRYWVRHGNDGINESVIAFEDIERGAALTPEKAKALYGRWNSHVRSLVKALPKPLWAIGAAAKATMLLAMTEIAAHFDAILDDTPQKIGRQFPGTPLKVEPLATADWSQPATVLLTAWNHREALTKRLRLLGYHGPIYTPHSEIPHA